MASKSGSGSGGGGSTGATQEQIDSLHNEYSNQSISDFLYGDGRGGSTNDMAYNTLVGLKQTYGDNVDNMELTEADVVTGINEYGTYSTENFNMRNSGRDIHSWSEEQTDKIMKKLIDDHAIIPLPNGNFVTNLQGFDSSFNSKLIRDTSD